MWQCTDQMQMSIIRVVLNFTVVNSKLNGCYYLSSCLSNFISVVDFKGDALCSERQKQRPQVQNLVKYSLVWKSLNVKIWAVRDLEGRNL